MKRTGKQIKTLRQLDAARMAKKSVIGNIGMFRHGPRPAAFVINMTGSVILSMIRRGLYIYNPYVSPWEKEGKRMAKLKVDMSGFTKEEGGEE